MGKGEEHKLWLIEIQSPDRLEYHQEYIYATKEMACKFALKEGRKRTNQWDKPTLVTVNEAVTSLGDVAFTTRGVRVLCE